MKKPTIHAMTTAHLCSLINETSGDRGLLLSKLEEANFSVSDRTQEGDSILHAFAQTDHISGLSVCYTFIMGIVEEGADINSVNHNGVSFLSQLLAVCTDSYTDAQCFNFSCTLKSVLRHPELDLSLAGVDVQSLMEHIVEKTPRCTHTDLLTLLVNSQTVDLDAAVFLLFELNPLGLSDMLVQASSNPRFNPHMKNADGVSLLTVVMHSQQVFSDDMAEGIIQHDKFDVNQEVNSNDNNLLQVLVQELPERWKKFCGILIENGIDLYHKNAKQENILDLIFQQREPRLDILPVLCKKDPNLLNAKLQTNQRLMDRLFVGDDYLEERALDTILKGIYVSQGDAIRQNLFKTMFDAYQAGTIASKRLLSHLDWFVSYNDVNVEYAFDVITSMGDQNDAKVKKVLNIIRPELKNRLRARIMNPPQPENNQHADNPKNLPNQKVVSDVVMDRRDHEDRLYYKKCLNTAPQVNKPEDVDNLMYVINKADVRAVRGCLLTVPGKTVTTNSDRLATTPLHHAILRTVNHDGIEYKKRLEIVRMLLNTPGIDVNAVAYSTEPVIFMATSIDNVDVLQMLLAFEQLDINKQDTNGYTALHDAVERGSEESVARLLEDPRIDTSIKNQGGHTAEYVNKKSYHCNPAIQQLFDHHKTPCQPQGQHL